MKNPVRVWVRSEYERLWRAREDVLEGDLNAYEFVAQAEMLVRACEALGEEGYEAVAADLVEWGNYQAHC